MERVKIGIVGIGDISGIYLENITHRFRGLEIVGVCDLKPERAAAAVEKYGIAKQYKDMYELFADPEVEIVLNLTRPYEHYGVTRPALLAGKHVYSEKPLAATFAEGEELVKLAREKGLLLGGAPDTFMGAGIQTCRKLIDAGFIGEPVGAAAFMICRGHESWHHDPDFYYQHGGGPMFDMGPYYVTALINLLGGADEVAGMCKASFPKRIITSKEHFGETINVSVPTYTTGMIHFTSGAIGTIFTTFDVHYQSQARLEIYGSEGTLIAPDPNTFGGPIKLLRPEDGELRELPLCFGYDKNSRGLGPADMGMALREGRAFRADCAQTLHVLEIMESLQTSGAEKRFIKLRSGFERRAPMKKLPMDGILE